MRPEGKPLGNTRHLFYNRCMNGKRGAPFGNTNAFKHGKYARSQVPLITDRESDAFKELILKIGPLSLTQTLRRFLEVAENMKSETDRAAYGKKCMQLIDMLKWIIECRGILLTVLAEDNPADVWAELDKLLAQTREQADEETGQEIGEGVKGTG